MRGKTRLRRYGIVVPDAKCAPTHAGRIMITSEGKMVPGLKPAVVGVAQAVEFADVDHGLVLSYLLNRCAHRRQAGAKLLRTKQRSEERRVGKKWVSKGRY